MKMILAAAMAAGLMSAAMPAGAAGIGATIRVADYHHDRDRDRDRYDRDRDRDHDRYWRSGYHHRHHMRYCMRWERHHHDRMCRGWGWRWGY